MLAKILSELTPAQTKLIAVSKTKPPAAILKLYEAGQRSFGENRALELANKHKQLPKDIEWHMIGHLQTNKVKYIAPFVHLVHSADSPKILKEINKQAARHNRVIDALLQFKIAEEETKYGFDLDAAEVFLQSDAYTRLDHIRICGVMGMATFTDDMEQVRKEFKRLFSIYKTLKTNHFDTQSTFKEVSMGMSGDYKIAIEEGSTMVRIGSLLFGVR